MKIAARSKSAGVAVAITVFALGTACSGSGGKGAATSGSGSAASRIGSANTGTSGSITNVVIGIAAPAAAFALPQIAADNNLWPSDIRVKFSVVDPTAIGSSLATGKIQLVLGASPKYDIVVAQSHVPISWLAEWNDPPDFQMIARPGINSVSELKGKTIAIPAPGSSVDYLSDVAMKKAGVPKGQYRLLAVGNAPEMVSTFISGTTDAFILAASSVQPILGKVPGSKVVYNFYTEKVPWIGAGIVGYNPWVKSHEAATVSVLKGLNSALKLVHDGSTKAQPSVAKFLGVRDKTAADLQFKYLVERTSTTLQRVSLKTLRSVYADVRAADNVSIPSDSFAPKMLNSDTYVDQAVK